MDRTCKGCLRKVALHPESHSHDVSIAGLLPCPPPRQYFSDTPGHEAAPMSTCLQLHLARPVLTPSDSSMRHSSSTPHPNRTLNAESTDPVFAWKRFSPHNETSINDSSSHPRATQKPGMCPRFLFLSLPSYCLPASPLPPHSISHSRVQAGTSSLFSSCMFPAATPPHARLNLSPHVK